LKPAGVPARAGGGSGLTAGYRASQFAATDGRDLTMIFGLMKPKRSSGPPEVTLFLGDMVGRYDIVGDFIVGVVGKIQGVKNGSIWIQARRRGKVVAEYLVPDSKDGWLHFKMPIEDRFTVEEVARDAVAINCVNSRGDAGLLTLDGSTRLQLIRQYMGVPVEPVLDLDFRRSGNAKAYLGRGWSVAEPDYTWTVGEESIIRFKSPAPPGPFLLRMTYSSFISEFVPLQPLDCYINDHMIASFTEDSRKPTFREFRFNKSVFHGVEESVIRLEHPFAAAPNKFAKVNDDRSLAFCFRTISILRVLSPDV